MRTTYGNSSPSSAVQVLRGRRALALRLAAALGVLGLGVAGADGVLRPTPLTYVCQGGVRVRVTPMGDTAVVTFAGRTTILSLMPGGSFRNDRVTWATQGGVSSLRDNATGRVRLSGCRAVR